MSGKSSTHASNALRATTDGLVLPFSLLLSLLLQFLLSSLSLLLLTKKGIGSHLTEVTKR